jgi:hypothetical protein
MNLFEIKNYYMPIIMIGFFTNSTVCAAEHGQRVTCPKHCGDFFKKLSFRGGETELPAINAGANPQRNSLDSSGFDLERGPNRTENLPAITSVYDANDAKKMMLFSKAEPQFLGRPRSPSILDCDFGPAYLGSRTWPNGPRFIDGH